MSFWRFVFIVQVFCAKPFTCQRLKARVCTRKHHIPVVGIQTDEGGRSHIPHKNMLKILGRALTAAAEGWGGGRGGSGFIDTVHEKAWVTLVTETGQIWSCSHRETISSFIPVLKECLGRSTWSWRGKTTSLDQPAPPLMKNSSMQVMRLFWRNGGLQPLFFYMKNKNLKQRLFTESKLFCCCCFCSIYLSLKRREILMISGHI